MQLKGRGPLGSNLVTQKNKQQQQQQPPSKSEIEGNVLNFINGIYQKSITNIILNGERLNISSKSLSALSTFIQQCTRGPKQGNKARKRRTSDQKARYKKLYSQTT